MDYEVERCTRRCAASGRELQDGEEFYSALLAQRGQVHRTDYAAEHWSGPPESALAWWKSRMPTREAKKGQLAPNEVLLHLFAELEHVPEKADMRYVLALLLVRRRVLREEEVQHDETGHERMCVYSPRDENTYQVDVVTPGDERTDEIQAELARLLYAEAT
jgi:hypothetical protein